MPIQKIYNKDFFKTWSHDMAYILGFLFADGNIVKTKRGTHFMAIYTADRELLIEMRRSIGSDHKISSKRTQTGAVYRIQIGSIDLFNTLARFGLCPGKVRRMDIPEVPKAYMGDFIRGYFDGDGNVWSGNMHKARATQSPALQASFTSSSLGFLRSLHTLLHTRGITGGGFYIAKEGRYARLTLSTLDALKLYEIMYNSPCKLLLERKKRIFERFARERELRA